MRHRTRSPLGLAAPYANTSYRADVPGGPITLRVGLALPRLDELLRAHAVATWAFVSAENPGSELLEGAENERRHAALLARVEAQGLVAFPGVGIGDDAQWPPERSLLVLGLSRDEARDLGRSFGQNAVVYGERGGGAELLWCAPPSASGHN